MTYTIETFWSARLRTVKRPSTQPILPGWSIGKTNEFFVEAELRLRSGNEDLNSPIWFVAAPGAVGKSTLAKEISARSGAVYLDLASAETVAGNYLTGGLVRNNLLDLWRANSTTALIDALDEARLRVTQKSFADFLNDVQVLAQGRSLPTVLFGRVGIVDEAWLMLAERGLECPIFDIDFFDPARAIDFVMASLDRLSKLDAYRGLGTSLASHRSVYRDAASMFVSGLAKATESDGARFAGYAPVLDAVGTVLGGVTNPSSLNPTVQQALQDQVLRRLAGQILDREAVKLRAQLPGSILSKVAETLYSPKEQLARLASIIFGSRSPPLPSGLQADAIHAYDSAIKDFLPHHPFLDGTGHKPSGTVFAAVINADALFSESLDVVRVAEKQAGDGPHTPNPFLIDFYLDHENYKANEKKVVPPEHVIFLYESIRARASAGDIVRLSIDGDDIGDEADVEIQVYSESARSAERRIQFHTSEAGTLRFGRQVNGVSIDAPQVDVTIGSGSPVEIVAPVSMNVGRLRIECPELAVLRSDQNAPAEDAAVYIEARELVMSSIVSVPIVRKGAEFSVSWPNANAYPWSTFATAAGTAQNNGLDDALRSLRRLVLAFRSHSKGALARYRDKIDHDRIAKGYGEIIRDQLLKDGILRVEGTLYYLDPNSLGKMVGANYQDLKMKRFSKQTRDYLSRIVG